MVYFKRVAEALVDANRYESNIFAKLENHIMNNLAMDYETDIIVDILFAFAKSGNGSEDFYNTIQLTITKGHLFNKNFLL